MWGKTTSFQLEKLFPTFYFVVSHYRGWKANIFLSPTFLKLPWDKNMIKRIRQEWYACSLSSFSLPGAEKWWLELWQSFSVLEEMWGEPRIHHLWHSNHLLPDEIFSNLVHIKITWKVSLTHRLLVPCHRDSGSAGLRWGVRLCVPIKISDNADAPGLQPTLGEGKC